VTGAAASAVLPCPERWSRGSWRPSRTCARHAATPGPPGWRPPPCSNAGDSNAGQALPPWSDAEKAEPVLSSRLEAGLLDARIARALGDQRRAAETLERVLELAEPHGFRRVFTATGDRELLADHLESGTAYWSMVTALVEQSPGQTGEPYPAGAGGEPMTEREVTVLRYLQSMLSNEEIASKLFVSVNTVKTHVRHIYRKLGVGHRRDAVRRARELHIL
jgi:LuxR family maltose regulon positive regulatory protein